MDQVTLAVSVDSDLSISTLPTEHMHPKLAIRPEKLHG